MGIASVRFAVFRHVEKGETKVGYTAQGGTIFRV